MGKMLEDVTKNGKARMGTLEQRAEHALNIARRAMGPAHAEDEEAPPRSREKITEKGSTATKQAAPKENSEISAEKESGEVSADDTIQRLTDAVSTLSTVAKGVGLVVMAIKTASSIVRMVQTVTPSRPLFGERKSSFRTVALVGAGTLVGAGVAAAVIASIEGDMSLAQRFEIAKQKAMFGMDRVASRLFGLSGTKKAARAKK